MEFRENLVACGDDWARCAEAKDASASLESAPKSEKQKQNLGGQGTVPQAPFTFFYSQKQLSALMDNPG
ncbi:MAG: hypothetical protein HQL51_07705 [Magnetococcales bacterium]|nr:hypothetical protein [Magnetococcales bacterium]